MNQPREYSAYTIISGWHEPPIFVDGPRRHLVAARLWEACSTKRGASFRAIDSNGEEFGTLQAGEQHGVDCFSERCDECGLEFKTPIVGEHFCPGCDLVNGGAW